MNIWLISAIAAVSLAVGASLLVAGVFVLFGLGWSLISGAVPMIIFGSVIVRGIARA